MAFECRIACEHEVEELAGRARMDRGRNEEPCPAVFETSAFAWRQIEVHAFCGDGAGAGVELRDGYSPLVIRERDTKAYHSATGFEEKRRSLLVYVGYVDNFGFSAAFHDGYSSRR